MPPFDVLQLDAPLFGDKILEASAGTGKTFAIEHLFVRLLLEAPQGQEPLKIEEILCITFTRAAAREMRMRIRSNLQKTLSMLNQKIEQDALKGRFCTPKSFAIGSIAWPYLAPHAGSLIAKRRMEDALIAFDSAQIFTIHGFCQRALSQFSLEAKTHFLPNRELAFRQLIQPLLLDFLEKQESLCPEQLQHVLTKKRDVETLADALLSAPNPDCASSFSDDRHRIRQAILSCPFSKESLRKDFERLQPNFKITDFKGVDFDEQLNALIELFALNSETALRKLIEWKGSIFDFLLPENRKVRVKDLFSSPIFNWCLEHLHPIISEATNPKKLFLCLRSEWQKHFEEHLEERGLFSPDFLLEKMLRALDNPLFLHCLNKKYQAAIIDEFQDTDAIQWDIFQKIFISENPKRLFCLVGDPKQSIYRFRKADLYTYFQARRTLGDQAFYSLDTNYRSVSGMISGLNDLFGEEKMRPWLILPKENRREAYRPILAGSSVQWDPMDGKKPIEFFEVCDLGEATLSFVYQEIMHLRKSVTGFGSFAILVKDRIQAHAAINYLQARSLPCFAKSPMPLNQSLALHALHELFDAIASPFDSSAIKIFATGPFVSMPLEAVARDELLIREIFDWKSILEKEGIATFFSSFLKTEINHRRIDDRIQEKGSLFSLDVFQIIEQLLSIQVFSYEAIKRFFYELKAADSDDDPNARRRIENDEEAIQIMTMHASKGLEFDIVFALGVAAKGLPDEDEELESNAEKMRQLYVSLTRAKLRQYIPLLSSQHASKGAKSPLDLFFLESKLSLPPKEIVCKLMEENENIGLEIVDPSTPPPVLPINAPLETIVNEKSENCSIPTSSGKIFSYSALRDHTETISSIEKPEEETKKTLHTLPRGAETGLYLHRIFEKIFSHIINHEEIHQIVHEELNSTILEEWIEPVEKMVSQVLNIPLANGVLLKDASNRQVEVEFLFFQGIHLFKGFIDLVVICQDHIYILDWKTNYLGEDDSYYSIDHLHKAMDEGDYWFQGSLYAEALKKAWPDLSFGGIYYLFLRGIESPSKGVLFFQPRPLSLEARI